MATLQQTKQALDAAERALQNAQSERDGLENEYLATYASLAKTLLLHAPSRFKHDAITAHLSAREQERKEANEQYALLDKERANAEKIREETERAVETITRAFEARLTQEPFVTLTQNVTAAETAREAGEKTREAIEAETKEKLSAYTKNKYYRYLKKRRYNTNAYRAPKFIQNLDAQIAQLVDFDKNSFNERQLLLLRERNDEAFENSRRLLLAAEDALASAKEYLAEEIGLTKAKNENEHAVRESLACEERLEPIRKKLDAIERNADERFELARQELERLLSSMSDDEMNAVVTQTKTKEDDALLERMRALSPRIAECEIETQKQSAATERLRAEYRNALERQRAADEAARKRAEQEAYRQAMRRIGGGTVMGGGLGRSPFGGGSAPKPSSFGGGGFRSSSSFGGGGFKTTSKF